MPEPNSAAVDLAVIGGGVIGLAVAWRAAQRGLHVTVLERDEVGHGTSYIAAGMLAPIAEVTPGEEPLLELGLRSARGYAQFAAELADAAGVADVGYTPCGTLLVARDNDEGEALERALELRRRHGLAVERLRASEARRREPGLAPTLRLALDVPDDHAIDPRILTGVLASAVLAAGGAIRQGAEFARLDCDGGRVAGVTLRDGSALRADHVVLAAGVWSAQLDGVPVQARVPVRPVKGQILRLRDPSGPGLLSRVLRMQPGYVVPRGDGRYVLGASVEERGFDTTVTAGPVFELLRDAIELLPGLGELVIEELSAGIRPGTPDNRPLLGPGTVPGLHWATGHYRHGILLAPITAEILADALTGAPPTELARECAPARLHRVAVGT